MTGRLWTPSAERVAKARLTAFIDQVNSSSGRGIDNYAELFDWSIEEIGDFWRAVWDFGGVIAETRGDVAIADGDRMPGARFFPGARLNFAENLLRNATPMADRCAAAGLEPLTIGDDDALVFWGEDTVRRRLSHDELFDRVSRLAQALAEMGVGRGDRVAAYLPNMPEAIIGMLATASIGATWSSCSPDFGVRGVIDRFGQIEPKVLICTDGYRFKGKPIDSLQRASAFLQQLPTVGNVIVCGYGGERPDLERLHDALATPNTNGAAAPHERPRVHALDDLYDAHPGGDIEFAQLPFDHPLYILFSSGTTGKPKCIVHGGGGTLLKHICEHQLMCDVRPRDRIFYFTTCGWMMWNWLASGLAAGATLLLFDGNPLYPSADILFDLAEAEDMTLFGTSAKFIDALADLDVDVRSTHELSSLRTMASTGSPLAPEGFDYVYGHIKEDICLSSIAGGTDLVGCLVGGNPIGPVWRGEIQARSLGMAVDVFDADGRSVRGEKGELVCTKPFPTMPVCFWSDADGRRYRAAYFERYPGIWWQGDFAEITPHDGVIIYGRSDATLNPGGMRIGTAEIYRQVEKLAEVAEGIVVGQEWGNDVRVVLFVRLAEGAALDDELVSRIKREIRRGASPRHVPDVILEVADIPRTKSGKITELAVRDVVHGRPVEHKEALANPEALDLFADRPELQAEWPCQPPTCAKSGRRRRRRRRVEGAGGGK